MRRNEAQDSSDAGMRWQLLLDACYHLLHITIAIMWIFIWLISWLNHIEQKR